MWWAWQVDGWMIVASILCGIACALVGNFLVLRKLSLIGDALSHAVLPGIAASFLWFGSRSPWVALLGAGLIGVLSVWLIEVVRGVGRIEESAAIGVVFTALFALGIVMISRVEHVDLDPSCVLYGNLETIVLETITTPLGEIPSVVLELGCIGLFNALCTLVFWKWWTLSTFDTTLAKAQGVPVRFLSYLLASMVAMTCVVCFRAVGNILVVAMLIVPSAIAWMLTNRLQSMVFCSLLVAIASSVVGHLLAISLPHLLGFKSANSAAMVAVVSGCFLVLAIFVGPKQGLIWRWLHQRELLRRILAEDILALLYRHVEAQGSENLSAADQALSIERISSKLQAPSQAILSALSDLAAKRWVSGQGKSWNLTQSGYQQAQVLIRTHRLWEHYLREETGISDPRLHASAESLEHYTSSQLRESLGQFTGGPTVDPHGKQIPPETP
ncbi:MAG: metal ABC transporter permease [Planctomycetota bacterium]|jgi:manganese/zinc/iron transport system permease protein